MTNINLTQLVNKAMAVLTPREREVLEKRWGLKDGQVLTLAEVGDGYGITRERVRQIEAGAVNKLRQLLKKGDLGTFFAAVDSHLGVIGGLRKESLLLDDLKFLLRDLSASNNLANKVKFLLDLSAFGYSPEDNEFHSYWYKSKEEKQKALGFVIKLVKFLEKNKEALINQPSGIKGVIKEAAAAFNLKEAVALNYVSLSKHFHINQYGDFGLASWSELNPKTVRHWAYLILRKDKKPLHFTEIAQAINKVRQGGVRPANAQTVHNELIKDNRFVLVGRGMYGLREFGLVPGTAREVLSRLLKVHGPKKPKEIVGLVKKERMFKDNTIFINLQNKKHFQRLQDGRYTIKEA